MNSLSAVTAAVPKQFLFSFSLAPTSSETSSEGLNTEPQRIRSPRRKPKRKPGPRTKPISAAPVKFLAPRVSPSRQCQSFTTEFKLGVLRWWEHGTVQTPGGSSRAPNRTDVALRYGLKQVNYLNRWQKVGFEQWCAVMVFQLLTVKG
jgi:hypothetical protein